MVNALSDYLQRQGVKVVEASLRRVAGKAAPFVKDEAHYRQAVIQPGWEALPPPVRLMMRRLFPRWGAFYLALRDEVFDLHGGAVSLRDDAKALVAARMKSFFGEKEGPPPPEAPKAGPPLATPVAASYQPPLAAPVGPPPRAAAPADTVVGIDLGTTYSLVAHLDAGGRPCTVPNAAATC
jgi:hypothetical protein